jgi:hypothetical protein
MSMVEIARFANLQEAQIAAARLRADGYPVLIQNENWAASDFLMTVAMGGLRLWAPASEAEAARRLIAELRAAEPPIEVDDDDREELARAPKRATTSGLATALRTISSVFLAFVFASPVALLLARRRCAAGGAGKIQSLAAAAIAVCFVVYGLVVLAVWLGSA